MPLRLFTSRVKSSTPGDMVGGGFYKSESLSFALNAADSELRSGSSSPAPRMRESSSKVSSRPSLEPAMRGRKSRSRHSRSFGSLEAIGSVEIQSGSHSDELADADASNLA